MNSVFLLVDASQVPLEERANEPVTYSISDVDAKLAPDMHAEVERDLRREIALKVEKLRRIEASRRGFKA